MRYMPASPNYVLRRSSGVGQAQHPLRGTRMVLVLAVVQERTRSVWTRHTITMAMSSTRTLDRCGIALRTLTPMSDGTRSSYRDTATAHTNAQGLARVHGRTVSR